LAWPKLKAAVREELKGMSPKLPIDPHVDKVMRSVDNIRTTVIAQEVFELQRNAKYVMDLVAPLREEYGLPIVVHSDLTNVEVGGSGSYNINVEWIPVDLGLGLSQEEIERRYGEPPWVLLNEILETLGLPFRAVFPTGIRPTSLAYDNTFALRLQDVERGREVPFEGLSSGEKVIMSTVLWRYGAAASPRRPRHGPAAGSAACSCGERTSFTLTNSPVEDILSDQGRLSDEMRCANSSRERRPRQRPSTRLFPVGRAVRGRAAILRL